MRDLAWMDSALCAQTDPDLFHAESQDGGYREAQSICNRCTVEPQCTAYARQFEGGSGLTYRHGMWGARSPRKRVQTDRGAKAVDAP